jgi:hypothetical protein
VGGGLAAPFIVIIHAWQVIMNKRVGVNQLHSGAHSNHPVGYVSAECVGGRKGEQRPYSLAAGTERVFGGLLK